MDFLSPQFFAAFVLLWSGYRAIPRAGWQNALLLLGSLAFIACFGKTALPVLIISTAAEYGIALGLEKAVVRRRRLAWLWSSILLNLALLAFFKYSGLG